MGLRQKAQTAMHLAAGLSGVVAVVLLAAWHDINGTTALVAILAMTGTAGAHGVAAVNSTTTAQAITAVADAVHTEHPES